MSNKTIEELLGRSNRLGSNPKFTNYAGGNTSAKGDAKDPSTGQDVEVLYVKGSGGDLGTLKEAGLAGLYLDRMRALVNVYRGVEHEDEMDGLDFKVCVPPASVSLPTLVLVEVRLELEVEIAFTAMVALLVAPEATSTVIQK